MLATLLMGTFGLFGRCTGDFEVFLKISSALSRTYELEDCYWESDVQLFSAELLAKLACDLVFIPEMFSILLTRALPDMLSGPEVREIFKIRTVRKPNNFLPGLRTFKTFKNNNKKKNKKSFFNFFFQIFLFVCLLF